MLLRAMFASLLTVSCVSANVATSSREPSTIPAADPVYEPKIPGCQDLSAKPANPIPLKGRVFGTYLPDGKRYTKLTPPVGPDFFEVGMLDLNRPGSKIVRLTNDLVHDAEVRVAPHRGKIVWTVRPHLDGFEGESAIMIANPDMSGRQTLIHKKSHYYGIPNFTKPYAERVMFSSQGDGDNVARLMFVDLRTGKSSYLQTTFKGAIGDPQMSRDGKFIVFKSHVGSDEEETQIFIMNSDGTGAKRLTNNDFKDEDPSFSPDGRYVAFERMYGPSKHRSPIKNDYFFGEGIVVIDLVTGRETALTPVDPCGKNELWLPTWSPDGQFIMFTRGLHLENGEFTHDLWVMRRDGRDLQRVPGSEGIMFLDWVE